MVIYDFHVVRPVIFPSEAYPPLAIESDAELARPATGQGLKPVAGQSSQIL